MLIEAFAGVAVAVYTALVNVSPPLQLKAAFIMA